MSATTAPTSAGWRRRPEPRSTRPPAQQTPIGVRGSDPVSDPASDPVSDPASSPVSGPVAPRKDDDGYRLALQLRFSLDRGVPCGGLLRSSPSEPSDDVCGGDAALDEPDGDATNLLD